VVSSREVQVREVQSPAKLLAAARRRENRKAKRRFERSRADDREEHERDVAVRMFRRFYSGEPVSLILLRYDYWQLRRCGWDLLKPEFSRDAAHRPCNPHDSYLLYFWGRLHPKTRDKLVRMSPHRLFRAY